jgi:3-oxoacyl-[acyl-carrier protein] reductase
MAAIDMGLYFGTPSIAWYVGLSGVLHGMLAAGAFAMLGEMRRFAVLVLAGIAAKLVWEQTLGPLPFSESATGGTVITAAHLFGAIGGAAYGAVSRYVRGRGAVLRVGEAESIDALLTDAGEREGAPTILVNNAGITRDNLLMRMKPEEWDEVIDTNLSSLYRVTKACVRGMIKARQGSIVNIASVVALSGNPGQTNYAAAKGGMLGFSKSLARELASRNITVNVIAPGFIDTDMTRSLTEEQVEALRRQIPCGRLGMPEDIAAAVVFLAYEAGRYITGVPLNVNGGLYMQ